MDMEDERRPALEDNGALPGMQLNDERKHNPGAAAPLAKVTGMIVTVRVRLRAAAGCKAPPSRPAQRKFCGV